MTAGAQACRPLALAEAFRAAAAQGPERIAVDLGERQVRYGELAALADGLGARLSGAARVALLIESPLEQVAATLAVLAAGACCVPLDPRLPVLALRELLGDAEPDAVVAAGATLALARSFGGTVPVLDAAAPTSLATGRAAVAPSSLAFIVYTSGSTGRQKGVVHDHASLWHNARLNAAALGISEQDRIAWLAHGSFMAALSDLFGALLNGAALCPIDVRESGATGLVEALRKRSISVASMVPALFRRIARGGDLLLPELRLLKLAGEPALARDAFAFRAGFAPGAVLLNSLGATEKPTIRHWFLEPSAPVREGLLPVGFPVWDTRVRLLAEDGAEAPIGAAGRIAVASPFLARGYWRQDQATAAAFRTAPDGTREFLSGDLGVLDEAGCLTCIGRADQRVKIRGEGVALPAVEAALLAVPAVEDAAIVATAGVPEPALVAHVVGSGLSAAELRRALRVALAPAAVPRAFRFHDALPRLATGKIDRAALLELSAAPAGGAGGPARSDVERTLERLFRSVLEAPTVGREDDFFELGGDSLAAAALLRSLEQRFGLRIGADLLARAPTIAALAREVAALPGGAPRAGFVELAAGPEPPLYFVPGAGGESADLLALARLLAGSARVLVAALPTGPGAVPTASVAAMATAIAAEVVRIQPAGPYRLLGFSLGGSVAFEVARSLRARGQEVPLLALIDSFGPGFPQARVDLGRRRRAALWLRRALLLPPDVGRKWTAKRLLRAVACRAASARVRLARRWPWTASERLLRSRRALAAAGFLARRRYAPDPLDVPVLLVRSAHPFSRRWFQPDPTLGWRPFAPAGLEVRAVGGRHRQVLRRPRVLEVARILRERL